MGSFVPCSSRHKSCSPAHAELVNDYRLERWRQEALFEAETGLNETEIQTWKENGNKLIDFKGWLKAKKGPTW